MHEYSVVRSLLREVRRVVPVELHEQVRRIRVQAGEFSGIDGDLLALAFEQMIPDTEFSRALLVVERIPLRGRCEQCGVESMIEGFRFQCRLCNSGQLTITSGEGFLLESVTIEERD